MILKKSIGLTFIKGAIEGFEMQEEIQERVYGPKPNMERTAKKIFCLNLSKALDMYIFIIIP